MAKGPIAVKPPADLLETHYEKLWLDVQHHLRKQGTWHNTDAPLLEAYVRSVALARSARAAVADSPFVEGSRGQLVPHPGVRMARDAESDARAAANALLLTPEARKRHDLSAKPDADVFDFSALVG